MRSNTGDPKYADDFVRRALVAEAFGDAIGVSMTSFAIRSALAAPVVASVIVWLNTPVQVAGDLLARRTRTFHRSMSCTGCRRYGAPHLRRRPRSCHDGFGAARQNSPDRIGISVDAISRTVPLSVAPLTPASACQKGYSKASVFHGVMRSCVKSKMVARFFRWLQ